MTQSALDTLTANTVDVISRDDLERKLGRDRPLRVKLGIDPTRPDVHLGFAVVLRKLREFQDLGHTAVLVIGDVTGQVGDPSGRSATRPRLTETETTANAQSYFDQVGLILDSSRLEVHRNSEWFAEFSLTDLMELMGRATVAQILERDEFRKRYDAGTPISVLEFLYPLLQGWDSVKLEADVELGGTDQLFNNLMGRTLQAQVGQEPQVVITMPILEGLDGVQKMSKSLDNYVGITEAASEQFGKLMSLPDPVMDRYFRLATGWPAAQAEATIEDLAAGRLAPVAAKRLLARTVVELYHGENSGAAAEAAFDQVFKRGDRPDVVPEVALDPAEFVDGRIRLARVLALVFPDAVPSNKEGARKIQQGGVKLNGERVEDPEATYTAPELGGVTVQLGKRHWATITSR